MQQISNLIEKDLLQILRTSFLKKHLWVAASECCKKAFLSFPPVFNWEWALFCKYAVCFERTLYDA